MSTCLQDGASLVFITDAWKQVIIGKKYHQTSKYAYLVLHKITRFQPFFHSISFVTELLWDEGYGFFFYFRLGKYKSPPSPKKGLELNVRSLSNFPPHLIIIMASYFFLWGRRRRGRMVIGFTCQTGVLTLMFDGEKMRFKLNTFLCDKVFFIDKQHAGNFVCEWPSSYGSWIYNCLCNQCISPLKLWVRIPFKARCTRYSIMWLSLSVISGSFPGYSGFLPNKTDSHDMTEILLKVPLNTITLNLLYSL